MPRIDVGHITLNYEERGRGEAILFIPGLVGLLNAWEFQVAEFSKRYRCISFDHRGAGDSDKPKDSAIRPRRSRAMPSRCSTSSASARRMLPAHRRAAACCRTSPSTILTGSRCCIFSNTWVKADEYITRVQTTRKHIALSYGPEEYVKVSSLFTNGAMQFRYDLDKVMELERRALKTVAPVEVLAGRLDMTMSHDRSADLHGSALRRSLSAHATMPRCPSINPRTCTRRSPGSKLVVVEEGGHYSYRRHWQEWNKIVDPFLREHEGRA